MRHMSYSVKESPPEKKKKVGPGRINWFNAFELAKKDGTFFIHK